MKFFFLNGNYDKKANYLGGQTLLVRRAAVRDAESIHRAHMQSIQEICSKDYTAQEIQAWGNRPYHERQRIDSIKNDLVWVIEDYGTIEGFGHLRLIENGPLRQGHILGLYLTSKVIGKSLGKAIIDLMMNELKAAKIKDVFLEATISALPFYQKMGFIQSGPEISVDINGTPVRCYKMQRELSL